MKNSILASVVAIICTAAICVTAFLCVNNYKKDSAAVATGEYITESEAADYLGITEKHLKIMRENLKYLEGSYIVFTHTNDKGEDVTECVYSKTELKEAVSKLMSDSATNKINFKYIEQALDDAAAKEAEAK